MQRFGYGFAVPVWRYRPMCWPRFVILPLFSEAVSAAWLQQHRLPSIHFRHPDWQRLKWNRPDAPKSLMRVETRLRRIRTTPAFVPVSFLCGLDDGFLEHTFGFLVGVFSSSGR